MPAPPIVDVNLIAYNAAPTIGTAVESVLGQTWPAISLTVIDDGSSDATLDIVRDLARRDPRIQLKRNRCNGGAVANFQRAFWFGNAEFVMPKSADDVLAPDFIERAMDTLLAHPDCAMCHAGGLIFRNDQIEGEYPAAHRLHATGADQLSRARHVMRRYTSSPSFWGVYRRSALDRVGRLRTGAGWDHVFLAELALAGEIRHVPDPLYWRRDGGKPVLALARAATAQAQLSLSPDDELGEQTWRTPLITTAFGHIQMAATARLSVAARHELLADIPRIFRDRWLMLLRREAERFREALPLLLVEAQSARPEIASWRTERLRDVTVACETIVPEVLIPDIAAAGTAAGAEA